MQEQVYVDLFATKGAEYVLVIGYLLALIGFWKLLQVGAGRLRRSNAQPVAPGRWFAVARDRFYHAGHSWAQPADDGLVTVGLDDFAQKLVGQPTSIILPAVGAQVVQGESGSRVEVDGRAVVVLSPVDGEVVSQNAAVLEEPGLINRDPYGAGWLLKVKPSKMSANLKSLLPQHLVASWMESTERSLGRMMSRDLGVVLQDGGVPVTGIARALSQDHWDEIARAFFLTDDPTTSADSGEPDDTRADEAR